MSAIRNEYDLGGIYKDRCYFKKMGNQIQIALGQLQLKNEIKRYASKDFFNHLSSFKVD